MAGAKQDLRVRLAAFEWLAQQVGLHGDVLPRSILTEGFEVDGERDGSSDLSGQVLHYDNIGFEAKYLGLQDLTPSLVTQAPTAPAPDYASLVPRYPVTTLIPAI